MFVKQISVFLENNPGTLRELTELLGKGGIDLLALSIADTQSFGIVRVIVHSDQIDPAVEMLKKGGYICKVNHVICASVPDRPLGLCSLLAVIEQAGLSVEYMYSLTRSVADDNAYMRPDDLFGDDFLVILSCVLETFQILFVVMGNRDTDGGTCSCRLEDDRILQLTRLCQNLFRMVVDFPAVDPEPVGHRQTVVRQDVLHENFVLSDRRAVEVASGIRNLQHFQIALDRSVFTVGAVHDRDSDVDGADFLTAEHLCPDGSDDSFVVFAHDVDLCALGDHFIELSAGEELDVAHLFGCEESSVFGDIDRDDIIFVGGKSVHRLMGGNDRYFMFHAFAAEEYSYVEFHNKKPPSQHGYYTQFR